MNVPRVILTGIILIIVYFCMKWFVNTVLLHNIYMQITLWRPMDEMQHMMWMLVLGQALFAFVFAIIYAGGYDPNKPGLGQGFRFGLLIAIMIAPYVVLEWYTLLPLPGMLAVYWIVAGFVELIILGLIAGLIYKK